jgi:hypothetical protein
MTLIDSPPSEIPRVSPGATPLPTPRSAGLLCCGRCGNATSVDVVAGLPAAGTFVKLHCRSCAFDWYEVLRAPGRDGE